MKEALGRHAFDVAGEAKAGKRQSKKKEKTTSWGREEKEEPGDKGYRKKVRESSKKG